MKNKIRNYYVAALAVGILFTTVPAWAASVSGYAGMTNIQYDMVNPADGTIQWTFDDGSGGPDWYGSAWVEVNDPDRYDDYNSGWVGIITAIASGSRGSGQVYVDLTLEELSSTASAILPDYSYTFAEGIMSNDFSISPTVPSSTDPIDMFFSFDYEMNIQGQEASQYAYVSMCLDYKDEFGVWQSVTDGDLGYGITSEDSVSGTLSKTLALDPDINYQITFDAYRNQFVPEPSSMLLLGLGTLILRRRRV